MNTKPVTALSYLAWFLGYFDGNMRLTVRHLGFSKVFVLRDKESRNNLMLTSGD